MKRRSFKNFQISLNELKRDLKTPGAILMGLGSIVGTSIFVSIAIATQVAGNGIVIAVVLLPLCS